MKKPKLAWYESNKLYMDTVIERLKKDFNVKAIGIPQTAEHDILMFQPDVIIFDQYMEDIKGIELYKKLVGLLNFIPIFVTVWAEDDSTVLELASEGIEKDAIINKNLESESFCMKIKDCYSVQKEKQNEK